MSYGTGNYIPLAGSGVPNYTPIPYNFQSALYTPQTPQQASSGLLTIMVSSEEEMRNYPVAAGTTVLLVAFNLDKLWLKTTDTGGVPQPIREFKITETSMPNTAVGAVTRDEFSSLCSKVDKLIEELGGAK